MGAFVAYTLPTPPLSLPFNSGTMAKLKAVYGNTGDAASASGGAYKTVSGRKKDTLASSKMTLGGSAWGK